MITFNDQPMLLADPDGAVQRWMDRFLAADDMLVASEAYSDTSARNNSRAGHTTAVGVGRPNYPAAPRPRINTLYWPTGATRWACGYFLCTGFVKDKLVQALQTSADIPAILKIGDDSQGGVTLETRMYMLPPRPVSAVPGTNEAEKKAQLWLIPLVDVRYHWQFQNLTAMFVTAGSTTWATLISSIANELGESFSATPSADYLNPDPEECSRHYSSPAALLDAVAHSCGMRVVRKLDGTVELLDWTASESRYQSNLGLTYRQIAGGIPGVGPGPAKVVTVCRKYTNHRPYGDGSCYAYEKTPSAPLVALTATRHKTILTTAYANFTSGSGTPDNNTKLNTLATKIAADYSAQQKRRFDMTFAGVFKWEPTGYDDHTLWNFGSQRSDGQGGCQYEAQTRVQSSPANFGIEEMLHQDVDLEVIAPKQVCKAVSDIPTMDNGTCKVWRNDGLGGVSFSEVTSPAAITIKVVNLSASDITAATFLIVVWAEDANAWLAVFESCP